MQHPDPDDLALLALGESLGSAVDAHVAECPVCSSEIVSFRDTVGLAELSNFGEDAALPGEHVWQAIAAELGFAAANRGSVATLEPAGQRSPVGLVPAGTPTGPPDPPDPPDPLTESTSPASAPDSSNPRNGSATPHLRAVPPSPPPAGSAAGPDGPASDHDVSFAPPAGDRHIAPAGSTGSRPGRWSRWAAPLAAAVVGIAVGAGAVVLSQSQSNDVTIEAIAPLKPVADGPLGGDTGTLGEAELVATGTAQQVRVSAGQLPVSKNDYEVWLFGGDGRMVSLGTLSDRDGTFTVPQGINTQEYSVVDISDEAPDGNPAHSGISLIRGEFS